MGKSTANKSHLPATVTAEGICGRALAVLLEEPVTDAGSRPVSSQACRLGFVEDADPIFNFTDDH